MEPRFGHIDSMAFDPTQRRDALKAFLERHEGLNINLWERTAELGEGTLRKFIAGLTKSLTDETYTKLAEAATELLGRKVELYELQGGDGHIVQLRQYANAKGATSRLERADIPRDQSVTALLMWKVVHGSSGRSGAFVLSSEPVGEIPRTEPVLSAKKSFSCKLLDNANAPGYRAGHVVVVDPDVGAVIGDLCIFTDERKIEAGAPSIAAIFRGVTATHWIITQNEVPGEQQISRDEYPQAWPVVVHYPHGA